MRLECEIDEMDFFQVYDRMAVDGVVVSVNGSDCVCLDLENTKKLYEYLKGYLREGQETA